MQDRDDLGVQRMTPIGGERGPLARLELVVLSVVLLWLEFAWAVADCVVEVGDKVAQPVRKLSGRLFPRRHDPAPGPIVSEER